MTGRGGKSQKHLSLNSWRHPECWVRVGFLFIPAPPYRAAWATVVIRRGNDLPVRVQFRQGEPRGCGLHKFNLSGASFPRAPYVKTCIPAA